MRMEYYNTCKEDMLSIADHINFLDFLVKRDHRREILFNQSLDLYHMVFEMEKSGWDKDDARMEIVLAGKLPHSSSEKRLHELRYASLSALIDRSIEKIMSGVSELKTGIFATFGRNGISLMQYADVLEVISGRLENVHYCMELEKLKAQGTGVNLKSDFSQHF